MNQEDIKNKINSMDDIKPNKNKVNGYEAILKPTPDPSKPELTFHYNKNLPQPSEERLTYLRQQVKELAKLPQPEQRSEDWYAMRKDKITASDWAAALGKNPYSYRNKLIRGKCGEKQSFYGGHMQHGVKYEDVAIQIYEYRNKTEVIEFGLIPHPKIDFLGASPDGITPDGVMVEIKCPPKRKITGEPPIYYWIQVQGQLEVCELDRCDFLECKIIEYERLEVCPETQELEGVDSNEEDDEIVYLEESEQYFNDNYEGDYFYNEHGLEKGVVLVFADKVTNDITYKYSKLGIQREEYDEWLEKTKKETIVENNNLKFCKESFWKLTEVSNVPIYRNEDWFQSNLPDLTKFWDDVIHYREVGIEEIKAKPRRRKASPKPKQPEIFIDTSIDDYQTGDDKQAKSIVDYHNTEPFMKKSFFSKTQEKEIETMNENKKENKNDNKNYYEDSDIFKNKMMFRGKSGGVEQCKEDKKDNKFVKKVNTQSIMDQIKSGKSLFSK